MCFGSASTATGRRCSASAVAATSRHPCPARGQAGHPPLPVIAMPISVRGPRRPRLELRHRGRVQPSVVVEPHTKAQEVADRHPDRRLAPLVQLVPVLGAVAEPIE